MYGLRVMAGLTTLFNVLALNLALVVAALPLITAPAAVSAASATLDRWRRDGEDRVVRQFIIEFRGRFCVRTWLGAGVPMAFVVLGLLEIRHFAREATLTGRAGLVLGGGALLVTLAALGYLFQLVVDQPDLAPVELWSLSARLAVRNLLVAVPLSAVPVAGVTFLAGRDPAVLLLGLPLFLLHWLKLIAQPGLRRAGLAASARAPAPVRADGLRPAPLRLSPGGAPGTPSVPTPGSIRVSGSIRCTRILLFLPEARILPVDGAQVCSRGGCGAWDWRGALECLRRAPAMAVVTTLRTASGVGGVVLRSANRR
jgi:hypothetical protein